MAVLLYGCGNWIMTDTLWEKLEAFQGELVKRILKWPNSTHYTHDILSKSELSHR